MDKIKELDIDLDISDRTKIYDYGTCREIHRADPNMPWEPMQFASLGHLDHIEDHDENLQLQVRMMDYAIIDTKGVFQTERTDYKHDEPAPERRGSIFDNKPSNVHLPRRALPIYHPGDLVKGNVTLKLKEQLTADWFSISLFGYAKTNLRIYNQYGYSDVTNYEKYIEKETTLWEKTDSLCSSNINFTHTSADDDPARSPALAPGVHTFYFEFRLPENAPPSTPNLVPSSGNYCFLIYTLKAELHSGRWFGRGDVVLHKGIWVDRDYDIGKDPRNLVPVTFSETLDAGLIIKSGKITMKVTLPSRAFLKGDTIPVKVEVDNQTKGEAKMIKARIEMHGKFKHKEDSHLMSQKIEVKGRKVRDGPAPPHALSTFNFEIPWDFSHASMDSNLMPIGNLNSCKLIEIQYSIIVRAVRKGLHRNLVMEIPVTIGNINSSSVAATDLGSSEENQS